MRANIVLLFRVLSLAFALNGLIRFAFAMRWSHVSFNLEDVVALVAGSAIFALFMGWLDRYETPT